MYQRILVAVEHSPADRTILEHVERLASLTGAELFLVHVADGWAARHFNQLKLRESEEMKADRDYLDRLASELSARGLTVSTELAMGDPATELIDYDNVRKVAHASRPKMIVVGLVLVLAAPWMMDVMNQFTVQLFENLGEMVRIR